jgi:hypothetical protein
MNAVWNANAEALRAGCRRPAHAARIRFKAQRNEPLARDRPQSPEPLDADHRFA